MRKLLIGLLAALPLVAFAQTGPEGRWKTIDDETGKVMTITEVYPTKNGTLAAKIVEIVDPSAATCNKCSGEKKGKSTIGMNVFWNAKPKGNGVWGDGEGFKPSAGMSFRAKEIKLVDGGNKLEVTGCKLFICRTAIWVRE